MKLGIVIDPGYETYCKLVVVPCYKSAHFLATMY